MKILFINASPNKNGKTSLLAKGLLNKNEYKVLNLIDYKIYAYGQHFDDDQFEDVINQIRQNEVIVFGTPVYWHNICGLLRSLLDRTYGYLNNGEFSGKRMFFSLPRRSTGKMDVRGLWIYNEKICLY